jgi:hypothetical protein
VVAVDARALGQTIVLVRVDRLLVDAVGLGVGVLVGAGEALEGRGRLLEVVGREGIFAPARCCVSINMAGATR